MRRRNSRSRCYGQGIITDFAAGVRRPLDASNAALERAKSALTNASSKGSPELQASLAAAQVAVREVSQQQESVVQQLNLLASLGLQLQKEKAALQQDKSDLEKRERLFSTGFYAALITALVAIASVIGRFPMMRLDMQLKRLEIKEKELGLREKQAKVNAET